jgi:ATP-dependent RNA helicase DDX21
MKRFREHKFQVLVATDVASRGLDIPDVELIIQLEPPKDTESYIHRSGRTARAGKSGTCITFFNRRNEEFVDRIEQLAGIRLERIGVPTEADMQKAQTKGILGKLKDVDKEVLPLFDETAELLL